MLSPVEIQDIPTEEEEYPALEHTPYHVGIIMDGNGRWATSQGKSRHEGHRAGTENLRQILEHSVEFGVKMLTIYAFSTENWRRPEGEIKGLMAILNHMLDRELRNLHKNGVQLRHIGQLDPLAPSLQKKIVKAMDLTENNDRLTLNVAFNYGGRAEIVHAIKAMMHDGVSPDDVDETLLSRYLYTSHAPDPELIIRTSGEFRTSNFLLWQAAYAEYYVTPVYWPDFNKNEYWQALSAFSNRSRRFGGLSQ